MSYIFYLKYFNKQKVEYPTLLTFILSPLLITLSAYNTLIELFLSLLSIPSSVPVLSRTARQQNIIQNIWKTDESETAEEGGDTILEKSLLASKQMPWMLESCFILQPGANIIKLFLSVIY
jgi:hypothetical protein